MQLIYGLHSIRAALANPKRSNIKLVGTNEGFKDLFKGEYQNLKKQAPEMQACSSHEIQEKAKKLCLELEFYYSRVPSQVYLLSEDIEVQDAQWLFSHVRSTQSMRILALDGISDVHNGAAIMRTASFYGIDALIVSGKSRFGFSPSLFRIASGATEWLNIVQVSSLAKTIGKLKKMNVQCLGLSEHAQDVLSSDMISGKDCLIMGTEDVGLSNAVERLLDKRLSIKTQGDIKSLNVSVATAVTLEKCFGA